MRIKNLKRKNYNRIINVINYNGKITKHMDMPMKHNMPISLCL